MAKRLLIIDNDDLTESIEKINSISKKKNLNIECYPLLIGLPDGNDVVDENGKISQELVLKKFQKNQHPLLIVVLSTLQERKRWLLSSNMTS